MKTAQVDADNVPELVTLLNAFKPELVINVALPYQDLTIMDACLEAGVNYMDTANYEPKDEAKFEYSWQWAYKDKFEKAGLTAILGCGFDPGVTSIYTAYAAKLMSMKIIKWILWIAMPRSWKTLQPIHPEINIREFRNAENTGKTDRD
jgi:saccharopine dehydrogenase-like NADP-dependent oxidoreductase